MNLGLGDAPESPITPYTGQDAADYDVLPEDDAIHGGGEDPTTPLTGGSKSKGKGRVLFDSGVDDEERGISQPSGLRRGMGISASSSLPSLATAASAARTRKERRQRVDSNAEAHTSAFMGLHRRNISTSNVTGGVGAVGDVYTEMRELLLELKNEREALRVEREALRVEREALVREREAIRTKIGL